ncbi:hypothetical protein L9F63_011313, partial [Diploptera punctata]
NPRECPRQITNVGISPITKLFIVRIHNLERNSIASGKEGMLPPSENMQSLEWSDQLSTFAQRWANQCIHVDTNSTLDTCRDMMQYGVKQIVQTKFTKKKGVKLLYKWQKVVTSWYKPGIKTSLDALNRHNVGAGLITLDRYSYLLNAAFEYVGCGYMEFKYKKGFREVYVCNYGP